MVFMDVGIKSNFRTKFSKDKHLTWWESTAENSHFYLFSPSDSSEHMESSEFSALLSFIRNDFNLKTSHGFFCDNEDQSDIGSHKCSAALSNPGPSNNKIKWIYSCFRSLCGHVELAWLVFVACWVLGFFIFIFLIFLHKNRLHHSKKTKPSKTLCSLFKAGKSCANKAVK